MNAEFDKLRHILPSLQDGIPQWDTSRYPLPGEIISCMLCTKPFLMRYYSGAPDQVCGECFTTYQDCCKIVCAKCRMVIARVKPEVLPNGFYVRPRSVLHTNQCNVCAPGLAHSHLVEVTQWERETGRHKTIVPIHLPDNLNLKPKGEG